MSRISTKSYMSTLQVPYAKGGEPFCKALPKGAIVRTRQAPVQAHGRRKQDFSPARLEKRGLAGVRSFTHPLWIADMRHPTRPGTGKKPSPRRGSGTADAGSADGEGWRMLLLEVAR